MRPFYAWVDARYTDPVESWKIKQRTEHLLISISVDLVVVTLLLRAVDSERRKLQQSEEKYHTLFENANDGIAIISLNNGHIEEANRKLVEISGYLQSELSGKSLIEVLPAGSWQMVLERLRNNGNLEADLIRKDRALTPVAVSFSVVETDNQGFVISIIRDISEARNLEKEREQIHRKLYQSSRLVSLGELSAGVAHEINNPLNSIINFAQLMLDDTAPERPERRMLEGIISEGDRITRIVRDLLTFARHDSYQRRPIHLRQIIEQSFSLFGHQLEKDGIRVNIETDPELPPINAEASQLKQVLINLISNAHYALKTRGADERERTIKVSAISENSNGQRRVKIRFFDNGIGIAQEDIGHVFDPFFTTKRDHGGTGLGLSVSFGIVCDHGGTIQVESQRGEYTCFTIDLPVNGEAQSAAGPQ